MGNALGINESLKMLERPMRLLNETDTNQSKREPERKPKPKPKVLCLRFIQQLYTHTVRLDRIAKRAIEMFTAELVSIGEVGHKLN